ncbi:MAG: hypothetical protein WCG27_09295 [Pseudomonadota bacterium]
MKLYLVLTLMLATFTAFAGFEDKDEKEKAFDQLATLLQQKEIFQKTPIARQHKATNFEVKVQIVDLSTGEGETSDKRLQLAVSSEIKEVLKPYGDSWKRPNPSLSDFMGTDVTINYYSHSSSFGVLKYLLKAVVIKSKRVELGKLLDLLDLQNSLLQMYDTSTELMGDELFFLKPASLDKLVIIKLSFAKS